MVVTAHWSAAGTLASHRGTTAPLRTAVAQGGGFDRDSLFARFCRRLGQGHLPSRERLIRRRRAGHYIWSVALTG